MLFIHVDKTDTTGGFLIPDTEEDRELIKELLKSGKYIIRQSTEKNLGNAN